MAVAVHDFFKILHMDMGHEKKKERWRVWVQFNGNLRLKGGGICGCWFVLGSLHSAHCIDTLNKCRISINYICASCCLLPFALICAHLRSLLV